ncbi:MAG: helix-turn-helix domain-containing protein [Gemmobacter sp.]|nr:helix-turn-helix domain-containing protein [Gemmobacter sp.]
MMLQISPTSLPGSDQRKPEILASVREAFADKGFDATSMQDLARATGMSVGNFYRYFPSKAAIVTELIGADLESLSQEFATILSSDTPLLELRATLVGRMNRSDCATDGKLWAEITAAALRKPDIGAAAWRMETEIISHLTTIFTIATGLNRDEVTARFTAHASLIMALVKAAMMHPTEPVERRADLIALIMRTIDQNLDEIAAARVKG